MFRSLASAEGREITIGIDGRAVTCREGDNLAAVLLVDGQNAFRTSMVSGAPRGPYCMMGVCFDCLAQVDGVPNRQTCLIGAVDGMKVSLSGGHDPSVRAPRSAGRE